MLILALLAQVGMTVADYDQMKRILPACLDKNYQPAINRMPEGDRRQAEILCLTFQMGQDDAVDLLDHPTEDDRTPAERRGMHLENIDMTLTGLRDAKAHFDKIIEDVEAGR